MSSINRQKKVEALNEPFLDKNKEEDTSVEEPQPIEVCAVDLGYNQIQIQTISYFLVLCNLLMNSDHGIIPAALVEIGNDYSFGPVELGSLGSYVYFGFVVGSVVNALILVDMLHAKVILTMSFILNGVGALLFIIQDDYYVLSSARFMSGFG